MYKPKHLLYEVTKVGKGTMTGWVKLTLAPSSEYGSNPKVGDVLKPDKST